MKFRFLLILLSILGCSSDKTDYYIKSPQVGDIYIFNEGDTYAPQLISNVKISNLDSIYSFYTYDYYFMDAMPDLADVKEDEFNRNFEASYVYSELLRLRREEVICKIYRK